MIRNPALRGTRWTAQACALLAAACMREPQVDAVSADSVPTTLAAGAQATFDPSAVRIGQQVGPLTVEATDVAWSEALSTWTGSVRFRGELPLRGHVIRHFDFPEVESTCFEADSASALTLPRWPEDERRPWFCFENDSTAHRILGTADSSRLLDIVVDRFTTVRAFTDAVNSARLVEADACFLSEGPILARLGADSTTGHAWLRFEHGFIGDSGIASLIEPNGASLAVQWRRARGALELRGFDDFVRFEALLASRGDSLAGEARLASDAQLERDAGGKRVPAARTWLLVARAASCDSAAVPHTERTRAR
jgi:hypothetical protein